MRRPGLVALQFLCVLVFSGQATRDQLVKEESQRVQGLWQFMTLRENGRDVPDAALKDRTLFFSGDTFLLRQGEQLLQAGNQVLDPTRLPKTANFTVQEGRAKGTVLLGIYELGADSLRVALDPEGQKRPTELKSDAGSGVTLAVLKRVRPADESPFNVVGAYTSVGAGANGTSIIQDVEIERRGDTYAVTWKRNDAISSQGIALLTGDTLAVAWITPTQRGVAVYRVGKDGKLVGQYATFGGVGVLIKETMTPK